MSERALATKAMVVFDRSTKITEFGFSDADLAIATKAVISTREAAIMVTWSGVPATPALGHYCARNASCSVFSNTDVRRINVIRESTANAVVTITLEVEE